MHDIPLLVVALTVCAYWVRVGAMVVRMRRREHRDVGVVPERAGERAMWLLFVPVVALWCALPWLGIGRAGGLLAVPAFAGMTSPIRGMTQVPTRRMTTSAR